LRQNFKGDKRRKEELRKKKQEEKRLKHLNKKAQASSQDGTDTAFPEQPPAEIPSA